MKKCPFCAEEIQDAAVVCRYCGRDLKPTVNSAQLERLAEILSPIEELSIVTEKYFVPGPDFPDLFYVESGELKSLGIRDTTDPDEQFWDLPNENTEWLTSSRDIYLFSIQSLLLGSKLDNTLYLAESEGKARQTDSILLLFWPNESAEDPFGWRNINKGRVTHKARLLSKTGWEREDIVMRFAIDCAERAISHAEARIEKSAHKWLEELSFYRDCLEFARAKNEKNYQRLKEILGTDSYASILFPRRDGYEDKLAIEVNKRVQGNIIKDYPGIAVYYCLHVNMIGEILIPDYKRANIAADMARKQNWKSSISKFQSLGFNVTLIPRTEEEKLIHEKIYYAMIKEELDWQASHLLELLELT